MRVLLTLLVVGILFQTAVGQDVKEIQKPVVPGSSATSDPFDQSNPTASSSPFDQPGNSDDSSPFDQPNDPDDIDPFSKEAKSARFKAAQTRAAQSVRRKISEAELARARAWVVKHQTRFASVGFSRFHQVSEENRNLIREDAAVMDHLLAKSFSPVAPADALGVVYSRPYTGHTISYNDQGLMFAYGISAILIPDDSPQTESKTKEVGSAWERAKTEIGWPSVNPNRDVSRQPFTTGRTYKKKEVDRMIDLIRKALSNGGNIRGLADDDFITVMIYGGATSNGMQTVRGFRVKWKSLKNGGTGLHAPLEETAYAERRPPVGKPAVRPRPSSVYDPYK